ncbi:MAG: HNH endonuclease [Pseudolabrys sp.]
MNGGKNYLDAVIREGATAFRKEQMKLWAARCAATGCNVKPALDAAHIFRYLGEHTNRMDNGILLRADFHRLFDRNLLVIEEQKTFLVWRVSTRLAGSDYAKIEGKTVIMGPDVKAVPNRKFLARHFKEFVDV